MRELHDRFVVERLFPAIREITGEDPASGAQPTTTQFEVENYVRP